MAITTSGATTTVPFTTDYVLAAGNGGLDGTGTSALTTVAANANLTVGVAGEAVPTAITFTALVVALNSTVNFVGGTDTVTALTSAGGTLNVLNGATLTVSSLANVTALSALNIGAGSTLVLGSTVGLGALENIDFTGSTGNLVIPSQGLSVNLLTGIADFRAGNTLTIGGAAFDPARSSYDPVSGTLNLVASDGTSQALRLNGTPGNASFAGEYFHITNTAAGATISLSTDPTGGFVACYVRGTLIRTPAGEKAVEDLQAGDEVVTVSGANQVLRWIGRRSYGGRFLKHSPAMQPILFRKDSLGEGLPRRDLLVSQHHAMFLSGCLVPAGCLVNGTTIVQVEREEVDYFHLELDRHDVVFAEGAPSETFVEDGNRAIFHNAASYVATGQEEQQEAVYYAARVESGYKLEAIRAGLAVHGQAGLMAA